MTFLRRFSKIACLGAIALAIAFASAGRSANIPPSSKLDPPAAEIAINPLVNLVAIRLDGKDRIIAHIRAQQQGASIDGIATIRLADGKIEKIIDSVPGAVVFWRAFEVNSNGQCVFLQQNGELVAADAKTGDLAWHWKSEKGQQLDQILRFSADGRFVSTSAGRSATVSLDLPHGQAKAQVLDTSGRPTAMIWELATGKSKAAALDFLADGEGAIVLPCDASHVFIMTNNSEADNDAHRYNVDQLDMETHKRRHLFEVSSGLACLPMPSGKDAVVLLGKREMRPPESPVRTEVLTWSGVEVWDVEKDKPTSSVTFKDRFEAGQVRLAGDGKFVLFHDPGHWPKIWDIAGKKWVPLNGPEGCVACDISRDGMILVAAIREENDKGDGHFKLATYNLTK